ncbi:MAG: endonuclease/exonuclease/phosphatase family protein [Akkermansia sp.]|nr:endonuclease/exonuclease/phosphatase family protein [Akkermansia sp.]
MRKSRLDIAARLMALCKRADALLLVLVLVLGGLMVCRYGPVPPAIAVHEGEAAPRLTESGDAPSEQPDEALPAAGKPVRFLMYNVQNYFVAGEDSRSRYKSQLKSKRSRDAVADVIASAQPEIVGLVEIGGEKALADLQERLEERGLKYPHAMVLKREGEDRALALLSAHPIVSNNSRANYNLHGQVRRKMLRGILDVTVKLDDGRYFRIVGAHLKSRVSDDAAAAEYLRTREARTLAFYLHEQMRDNPHIPIVVYGDWNDGPEDNSLSLLRKGVTDKSALTRINPEDSQGQTWTLYYKSGREYYVFDQIFVNSVLSKRCGRKARSGIVDIKDAAQASDHRAVWYELR